MSRVVRSPDGVPISYEVHGAGAATLVFVHGWSCDRSYWARQLESFSRDFQVVAVDLAGHGESGVEREAWTIGAFGEDVAAVVEELGSAGTSQGTPKQAILIGHSMGGDVIVEAARRLPGSVAGLVWVDVYKELGNPRTPEEVRAMMAPFRAGFEEATREFVRGMFSPGSDKHLVERVVADMSSAQPAIALETMKTALTCEREVTDALLELKLPTVAINPDNRPTDIESMRRHGVDVVVMPGVGHFPMMEDPDGFNLVLRKVVDGLLAPGSAAATAPVSAAARARPRPR